MCCNLIRLLQTDDDNDQPAWYNKKMFPNSGSLKKDNRALDDHATSFELRKINGLSRTYSGPFKHMRPLVRHIISPTYINTMVMQI